AAIIYGISINVPQINASTKPKSASRYSDFIFLPKAAYIKAYCGNTTKYIIVQRPNPRVNITNKQNIVTAK
ncbi:MAG TPA: hypothetical protein PLE17_03095, partial [Soehngenia sp.]|nr:hypothetical protein [Soehngenia sp.]